MSEYTKEIIIKRFKSFLWRLFGYGIAGFLAFVLDALQILELSPEIIAVVGLVFGEVTKYLNVNLPEMKKAQTEISE